MTFTQLLSTDSSEVRCCFTSTETIWTLREREPKMVTSTFTQLLSSVTEGSMLLHVHTDRADYQGQGAQDVHFDFHTAAELWALAVASLMLYVHRSHEAY